MPPSKSFEPVRVGVAGLGRSGIFHVERIGLRDDCRIVALYDDCAAARRRSQTANITPYADWREFLSDETIDLVLLATPPALHAELAIQAMAAGKHVAIETPMCLSLPEAEAVVAASRRTERSVSVAHLRRWDDDFRTARAALASGQLGRPVAIKLVNWHYNPRWLSQAAAEKPASEASDFSGLAPAHWRDQASTGGGVLWEFGVHVFDQLLQLAGRAPESVYARIIQPPGAQADDGFLAIVEFSGGLVGHVEICRTAAAPLDTGWTIAGDAGSYAGFTLYVPNPDGEVADLPLPPDSRSADEYYAQLARHVRLGEPNPASADDARGAIALIHAVRQSARTGAEQFVEDGNHEKRDL